VMLDFYADWCVTCKELERNTFSDPAVRVALKKMVTLQADVTAHDNVDRELLRHFNIVGPPAMLFFGADGQERREYRLVGFMDSSEFEKHLQTLPLD
ncbi:MAG: thioredoxin family protein, partial [Gammaproteobacteria bacterium]|nr:thioredoxin family protein [Gammaproteobacteria bacterium]